MPIQSRPKQAHKQREEAELPVLKGIANSLSKYAGKKTKSANDGQSETFGSYVCETLQELEPVDRNIAQQCINNILFQAQMGTLNQNTAAYTAYTTAISSWSTKITTPSNVIFQPTAPNDAKQTEYVYPFDWPVRGHSTNSSYI